MQSAMKRIFFIRLDEIMVVSKALECWALFRHFKSFYYVEKCKIIVQIRRVWVTGKKPVYTRLCVKICHCDCIELDFCMLCEYNSLMKI